MMVNKELASAAPEPLASEDPSPAANAAYSRDRERNQEGARLVTVLYSKNRDLYRVPSMDKPCWLSVKVYEFPAPQLSADAIYLGTATTAKRMGWRKAYAGIWNAIVAGDSVTVPADDPMVIDYAAFSGLLATALPQEKQGCSHDSCD